MAAKQGFLIERYIHSELHYWNGRPAHASSGDFDHGTWTSKIDEAIWFADADSAALVLSWCLSGVGRVAEHKMIDRDAA